MQVDVGLGLALLKLLAAHHILKGIRQPARIEHFLDTNHGRRAGKRHANAAARQLSNRIHGAWVNQSLIVARTLMSPFVPTGQRFLASEMPLTGTLKPIDQHMQEELMRGTDLPIQLLLSQIKPKLLGKRGSLAQVVILGIDNHAVHVKDNGVERKCGHGTLPNKRTPASRRPSHALIGDSNPAAYPAPPQCHLRCYRRSPSGLQP